MGKQRKILPKYTIVISVFLVALMLMLISCNKFAEPESRTNTNLLGLTANNLDVKYHKKSNNAETPPWHDFLKLDPSEKPSKPKVKDESLSTQNTEPLILAHYMPWFQTPEITGYWGNHWTMNNCNPEIILPSGQREICAHYYPLSGPYDSNDPDLIDYHIVLMKLAGIDGILINWYGVINSYDWGTLRESTDLIVSKFNAAGMKVGIVYEDYTIKVALESGLITDDIAAGQDVMAYLEQNYFTLENYVRINGEPLLLNFGPVHYKEATQWNSIVSLMLDEPDIAGHGWVDEAFMTTFSWIEWPHWENFIENYYAWVNWAELPISVGSAYFGFHDYYAQGGWGDGLYYLDTDNDQRLMNMLNYNAAQNPNIIQLNTWNDFGEGTMIEPTVEFGYKWLQELQTFIGVSYDISHLKLATEYYELKKTINGSELLPANVYDFYNRLLE